MPFAQIRADARTHILVDMCADICVGMCADTCAYIVMAVVVVAYVVMAYAVMAYVVMAYVVMAYVVGHVRRHLRELVLGGCAPSHLVLTHFPEVRTYVSTTCVQACA